MIWIAHPLGYYGLLAVGLLLCLYLFVSVKKENAQLRHKLEHQHHQSQEVIVELRSALGTLEHSLKEHAQIEEQMLPQYPTPSLSINLTKRSQALRMYRRGESTEQICASLQLPRSEVELLIKVQKALAEQPC